MHALTCTLGDATFEHPADWSLETSLAEDGWSAELHSPGVSFGIVGAYGPSAVPEELIAESIDSLQEEHEGLEIEPLEDPDWHGGGSGVELVFLSLDTVSYCWVRSWRRMPSTSSAIAVG